MKELIATIHFLGLALFSTQVPDETGLRVLLPRIETKKMVQVTSTRFEPRIEPHDAYLVFPEHALLQEIGWTSEELPQHVVQSGDDGRIVRYRRVRLNGERLTFLARGDNPAVPLPYEPALPKVTCARAIDKNARFAAMVRIPDGRLRTCADDPRMPRPRYDTQLTLKNSGVVTVWAEEPKKPTKAIILDGAATIYVVNLPKRMFSDTHSMAMTDMAVHSADHFNAYYSLLRAAGGKCIRDLAAAPPDVPQCPLIALRVVDNSIAESTNSECSNSSWP